jgi:hypothetical protein
MPFARGRFRDDEAEVLRPEVFAVEVFLFAAPVREVDEVAVRDLVADERDLPDADDVFFADERPDEAFAPPDVFLDEDFDPAAVLFEDDFAPPTLLPDVDFAAPDFRFAVERPAVGEVREVDFELPELLPLAVDLELDAFVPVDLPAVVFFFVDEPEVFRPVDDLAPADVFREADDLLPPDAFLPDDDALLVPEDVFFALELLLPAVFLEVDFDLDDALFGAAFFDVLFEAVFFFVVAMCGPPDVQK